MKVLPDNVHKQGKHFPQRVKCILSNVLSLFVYFVKNEYCVYWDRMICSTHTTMVNYCVISWVVTLKWHPESAYCLEIVGDTQHGLYIYYIYIYASNDLGGSSLWVITTVLSCTFLTLWHCSVGKIVNELEQHKWPAQNKMSTQIWKSSL